MATMYPSATKEKIQPLGVEVDKGLESVIEVTAASRSRGHVIITRLLTKTKPVLQLLTTSIQSSYTFTCDGQAWMIIDQ
jgi:hypothetical protein